MLAIAAFNQDIALNLRPAVCYCLNMIFQAAATRNVYQDAQTDCQGYANGRLFVTDTIDKMAIVAGTYIPNATFLFK